MAVAFLALKQKISTIRDACMPALLFVPHFLDPAPLLAQVVMTCLDFHSALHVMNLKILLQLSLDRSNTISFVILQVCCAPGGARARLEELSVQLRQLLQLPGIANHVVLNQRKWWNALFKPRQLQSSCFSACVLSFQIITSLNNAGNRNACKVRVQCSLFMMFVASCQCVALQADRVLCSLGTTASLPLERERQAWWGIWVCVQP